MASHTWVLILDWASWCETINLHNPLYNMLVEMLVQHFEVIYTWSFFTVYDYVALDLFEQQVSRFVEEWRMTIANGRQRNYYHWLAVEAFIQIRESGSI